MGSEFNFNNWDDAEYQSHFKNQYAIGVAENACKFGATQPAKDKFMLQQCIEHVQAAADNNQSFRGHNFVWGMYNPHWLDYGDYDYSELDAIMKNHITTVMQGVKTSVTPSPVIAWDVVNEAWDWNKDDGWHLKEALPWYPKMHDYIDKAFTYAAQADPDMLLFYNDYNVSSVYDNFGKANAIADMAAGMKTRGIKIDGIGMQMHISTDSAPTRDHTSQIIKKFGDLGL